MNTYISIPGGRCNHFAGHLPVQHYCISYHNSEGDCLVDYVWIALTSGSFVVDDLNLPDISRYSNDISVYIIRTGNYSRISPFLPSASCILLLCTHMPV